MKTKLTTLWIIWTLLAALLMFGITSSEENNNTLTILARVLSLPPIMGLLLALGSPKALEQFKSWIKETRNSNYIIAGSMTLLFAIPGLLTGSFDPYNTILFAFIILAVFGVLKQNQHSEFRLNWSDIALWLLLWIPFDFRWYAGLQPNLDYSWWSMTISLMAVIGWASYRGANIGYRLAPKIKGFRIALLSLLMILTVVVPPGLATNFLTFSIPESYDIQKLIAHFVGLFLTVALPEELFFRGILLRGLKKVTTKNWVPIVVSSLAFGLMHWNNLNDLPIQIAYISLATFAGLGYGWAYIKSGNNLFAAILAHTLVDWIWKLYLVG